MAAPSERAVRLQARLAGVAYLVTIVAGVFAEAVVRGSLVAWTDPARTAANIMAAQPLYRAGGVADLAMLVAYLMVTALFQQLFAVVDRSLSRLAAFVSLAGIAVLAADTLLHFAPLVLLDGAGAAGALPQGQLAALALLSLKLHAVGYSISIVFFGVYCLLLGALLLRAPFLPGGLGLLMGLAGAGYLAGALSDLLAIPLPPVLAGKLMLPGLLGEGALSLWLIFRGVDAPKWIDQQRGE